MATNLETGLDAGEVAVVRPSLRITRLHLRGLKSIKSLDLPEDGMGWEGPFPDVVVVGGINGSGKTTLLEFIFGVFEQFVSLGDLNKSWEIPAILQLESARVDFQLASNTTGDEELSFRLGDLGVFKEDLDGPFFGFERLSTQKTNPERMKPVQGNISGDLLNLVHSLGKDDWREKPAVVYFPSERRTLISPKAQYKSSGRISKSCPFLDRWSPPENWDGSLEARLYGVRWEDLNAKEAGRPDEANGFSAYAEAFARFFEGRKQLVWTPKGELVVQTRAGTIHDLSELSGGEKQVVLFAGELLHRWRPGSLVLIDEPELHLHSYYQMKLWQLLMHWREERGGQLIVATQSGNVFGMTENGTRVVLDGWHQ